MVSSCDLSPSTPGQGVVSPARVDTVLCFVTTHYKPQERERRPSGVTSPGALGEG